MRAAITVLLFVGLTASSLARAQGSDGPFNDRRIAAARELEKGGQLDQAKQVYRDVLKQQPPSDGAAEALLSLARLAWDLHDPAQWGREAPPAAAIEEARSHLDVLKAQFPNAPQAAEGIWRLALLRLDPGAPFYNAEEGAALLTTLPIVSPDAPRAAEALLLAARQFLLAGRAPQAASYAFRVLTEFPRAGELCSAAWTVLARADIAQKRPGEALSELDKALRCGGREADVAEARDLARLLDRLVYRSLRGAGPLLQPSEPSPAFSAKDAMLTTNARGQLVATAPREGQVIVFSGDKGGERTQQPGIVAIGFDQWSRRWLIAGERLFGPIGVGEIPLPEKAEPHALAPAGPRTVWVVDGDTDRVLRLGLTGDFKISAFLPQRAKPSRVSATPDGGAWILDDRTPAAYRVGPDGKLLSSVALATVAPKPVDLALDQLGNVYILDEKAVAVVAFTPTGEKLMTLSLPKDGDNGFSRPEALAVDRSGAVAVYEPRRGKIQWFR